MGRTMLLSALVVRAAIVGTLLVFSSIDARAQHPPRFADEGAGHKPFPPIYNPYPLGLLPSDLESQIARVRREAPAPKTRKTVEHRSLAVRLAVSTVSVGPECDHHRPAGDRDPLAPTRFPRLLAVEVSSRWRPSAD
jgi:hypothetical protein